MYTDPGKSATIEDYATIGHHNFYLKPGNCVSYYTMFTDYLGIPRKIDIPQ
jgi:hypothetical protein